MKKTIALFTLSISLLIGTSFDFKSKLQDGVVEEICFKVKNDTGASVTLHTGKGTAPMSNGTVKEFCMESGSKLYMADKGQKGKVLVEVSASVKGKTFNLSDL